MNWLGVFAVIVIGLWLVVLTVALLLCVRQLAVNRVRLELLVRGGAGSGTGPTVGFSLAPALLASRPELARERALVVVLSGNCANCMQVIDEWESGDGPALIESQDVLLLVTGQEGAASEEAAHRLADLGAVVREPEASRLAQALNMSYRPSALLLEGGLITGTSILEHARELDDLLAGKAGGVSSAGPIMQTAD
jgi:hypothetical protein